MLNTSVVQRLAYVAPQGIPLRENYHFGTGAGGVDVLDGLQHLAYLAAPMLPVLHHGGLHHGHHLLPGKWQCARSSLKTRHLATADGAAAFSQLIPAAHADGMTAEEEVAKIHVDFLKAHGAADVACAEGLPGPVEVIEAALRPQDGLATAKENVERTPEPLLQAGHGFAALAQRLDRAAELEQLGRRAQVQQPHRLRLAHPDGERTRV
mmetsp:Transcript_70701/g.207024  ORF Transcript_70701/g.207024 Transcript_70701/m.207024 type:complete len:209 (+) Transcript_70701:484-1110(+)